MGFLVRDRLKIFNYRDRLFESQRAIAIMICMCLLIKAIAFKTTIDTGAIA